MGLRTRDRARGPSAGKWGPDRARRLRVTAAAVLAAAALGACAKPPAPDRIAEMHAQLDAGLALYGGGEYALAAPHFAGAARTASLIGDRESEARARAAECTAWLRARDLVGFSRCSEALGAAQRRLRRSDPGRNTLVALGAVAGRRPLPDLRLPDTVRPLLQEVAREFR